MAKRVQETERKYDGGAGTGHPDFVGLAPGARATGTVDLEAVYYDTAGLALAAHKVTLRRRTGGDDAGWHLKLPAAQADTRTEVRAPLSPAADGPPGELAAEVAALARGRELEPVVRLRTARRRVLLQDGRGRTLAEVAYDKVRAKVLASGEERAWSEVEVELGPAGEPGLLDAVEERLADAGLHRSASPSKLARALGGLLVAPPARDASAVPATAGETATGYLREQLTALLALDPQVRRGEEDAVHRMRVATRRARSALKSFRKELDRAVTDPVGDELKWLAAVLGAERDREVLAARLADRFAELEPGLRTADVRLRLDAQAGPSAEQHAAIVRALDGARYFALLDALEALTTAPPFRKGAHKPAAKGAARTVRRDLARVRSRVEAALAAEAGTAKDVALHEARKAAKRARYSAEAVRPVLGEPAKEHKARMKHLQQLLGEHQDGVLAREALERAAAAARPAGEDLAPYEAMLAAEAARARKAEEALPGAWAQADREL
jgi:CHAD domain-containing protein